MKLSHNYKISKDYGRLWELAQNQRIICFAAYGKYHDALDICATLFNEYHGKTIIELSCRGVSYVHATDKDSFILLCKNTRVEFIDPEESE